MGKNKKNDNVQKVAITTSEKNKWATVVRSCINSADSYATLGETKKRDAALKEGAHAFAMFSAALTGGNPSLG